MLVACRHKNSLPSLLILSICEKSNAASCLISGVDKPSGKLDLLRVCIAIIGADPFSEFDQWNYLPGRVERYRPALFLLKIFFIKPNAKSRLSEESWRISSLSPYASQRRDTWSLLVLFLLEIFNLGNRILN